MLSRRSLLAATAAVGSLVGSAFGGRKAEAGTYATENLSPKGDIAPRGNKGRLERIPSLDLESKYDFVTGVRKFYRGFSPKVRTRVAQLMEAKGIQPDAKLTMEETLALVKDDHLVQTSGRTWISNQQITWKIFQDYYHANADQYLAEMEAADNDGPGKLELDPDFEVPDYARHEIHIMPGGYVGDPFAGHIYHHGTNSFAAGIPMLGDNEQDQIQIAAAERLPLPEDGKVKRILDMGCGIGRLTVALKERFPDAEVWGVDIGGPMLRYAHMRARDLGVDVNFSQRSAEDTKFPDGHFDVVVSLIVNHELTEEANNAVIREAWRLTRPGGYYYPIDFTLAKEKGSPSMQYFRWWDHRWNCEPWSPAFVFSDFDNEIEKAGFKFNRQTPPAMYGFGPRHAVKPA